VLCRLLRYQRRAETTNVSAISCTVHFLQASHYSPHILLWDLRKQQRSRRSPRRTLAKFSSTFLECLLCADVLVVPLKNYSPPPSPASLSLFPFPFSPPPPFISRAFPLDLAKDSEEPCQLLLRSLRTSSAAVDFYFYLKHSEQAKKLHEIKCEGRRH